MAVYLSSNRYTGSFTKKIRVETNDRNHPNETLVCHGRILQSVEIKPSRVNFGSVARTSATQYKTVTLLRADGGPISPEVKRSKLAGLNAQICEIEPGDHYELEISVGPPWPQGAFKDVLYLSTGVDVSPEATILITGTVAQRLTAVPSRFVFPKELKEESERSVHLQWADDAEPAKILEATSTIPEANVRVEDRDGKQILVVTLPTGSGRIAGSHAVTIKTDDQEVPTFSVPITFRQQRATPRGAAGRPPVRTKADVVSKRTAPVSAKKKE